MILESEIIEKTILACKEATGFKLTWTQNKTKEYDALVRLTANKTTITFCGHYKKTVSVQTLGLIASKIQKIPGKSILLAEYINPSVANKLKQLEIPFIDSVGNIFINEPGVFVFVSGNKAPKEISYTVSSTFSPAALKVIFVLLCDENLINTPLRNIAIYSGVTLGTAARTVKNLDREGYLFSLKNGLRKVVKKQELLNHWLIRYPTLLRPKLVIGSYSADNEYWWKSATIDAYWGGEVAAAKLSDNLRPARQTVYTYKKVSKLILSYRLKPNAQGHIQILKAFWQETLNINGCVPTLLVYADLIASGDPRNIEAANLIYERELSRYFQ